jgi:hypothetical protein
MGSLRYEASDLIDQPPLLRSKPAVVPGLLSLDVLDPCTLRPIGEIRPAPIADHFDQIKPRHAIRQVSPCFYRNPFTSDVCAVSTSCRIRIIGMLRTGLRNVTSVRPVKLRVVTIATIMLLNRGLFLLQTGAVLMRAVRMLAGRFINPGEASELIGVQLAIIVSFCAFFKFPHDALNTAADAPAMQQIRPQ